VARLLAVPEPRVVACQHCLSLPQVGFHESRAFCHWAGGWWVGAGVGGTWLVRGVWVATKVGGGGGVWALLSHKGCTLGVQPRLFAGWQR
jgi:hypothetical protein